MKLRLTLAALCCLMLLSAVAGSAGAASGPVKWEPLGLSGGGSMYRPSFSPVDPNFAMITSDMSGVFISHDAGRNWSMINSSQLRSSTDCYPGYHPTDANVIFAAEAKNGMKVTRDKGVTWTQVEGFPKKGEDFRDLQGMIGIDPTAPNRMMAGDKNEVFLSNDGGKTWAACQGPKGLTLAFHFDQTSPASTRVIFAATADGIWRSGDAGKTWKELPAIIDGRKLLSFSGGSNAKDKTIGLYASFDAKEEGGKYTGGIYRSTDGGKTWQSVMNEGINVDTKPADKYATSPIAQYPFVFTTNLDPKIVVAFNIGTGIKPPHHNTAFRSDDGGAHWRILLYPDPRDEHFNTDMDYWVKASHQYGSWEAHGVGFDYANPDRLMRSESSLHVTHDGGKTWFYGSTRLAADTKPPTWLCNGLVVTTTWDYYVDPFKPERRYIGYTDIGFAVSKDADKTWSWLPGPWGNTTYQLAFDPEVPGKVWGAFSNIHDIPFANIIQGYHGDNNPGGVAVSTNHCDSWKKSNKGLPDIGVISIVVDPKSPVNNRTLYCSVWKNGVYKSVDDGKTWTKASEGLGDPKQMYPCRIQLHADGTLFVLLTGRKVDGKYITQGPGLYRSTDGAKTWELVNKDTYWFWPKDFTVDPKNSKIIYVGLTSAKEADQAGLYRTTDGGKTWDLLFKHGREHFGGYLSPKHPDWIYATLEAENGLWLSKDNGKTFNPIKGMPFGDCTRVFPDPNNDGAIYVTTFGGSVWHGPASE